MFSGKVQAQKDPALAVWRLAVNSFHQVSRLVCLPSVPNFFKRDISGKQKFGVSFLNNC